MRPPHAGLWRRVPGYDSGSESDDDCEELFLAKSAKQRLRDVITALGERWVETQVVQFRPAPKQSPSHREIPKPVAHYGPLGIMSPPSFRIERADAPIVRDTLLWNGLV